MRQAEADPHLTNPLNVINQESISKVMMTRLMNGEQWADLVTIWAITTVMLLRFQSTVMLTLNKLFICEDRPPCGVKTPHDTQAWEDVHSKVDGRILSFLVPGADQQKRNQAHQLRQTEAVGCYRHKRFERDPSGIIGFVLLKLFNDSNGTPQTISFLAKAFVPPPRQYWGSVNLFSMSYRVANTQYKRMMDEAGVGHWGKVTHMR